MTNVQTIALLSTLTLALFAAGCDSGAPASDGSTVEESRSESIPADDPRRPPDWL